MRLFALVLLAACDNKTPDPIDDTGEIVQSSDADGDGFANDEDCDDSDRAVNPGAIEICDGIDNNCDGTLDEGVAGTYYADADGDGFGDAVVVTQACTQPSGYVSTATDCDDASSVTYPGASDVCDDIDNDCDGVTDEDEFTTWYADTDGDGFGDGAVAIDTCSPPEGYVEDDSDCDDTAEVTYPGAAELCDGADNDCDTVVDEETGLDQPWYQDRDEDGFGDASREIVACSAPLGYVEDATDCDDLDDTSWPDATEVCDDADNNCDGTVDEFAVDAPTWHTDTDADGYGDPYATVDACDAPVGFVADATDCDDTVATTNPGASEVCDGADNDCDATVDEASAIDAPTWYLDADGDAYGDPAISVVACDAPSSYVPNNDDCDDAVFATNPGASERCDAVDNNCDGTVDEATAVDASTWYSDRDGDSFGDAARTLVACDQPADYVADATDCDDLAAASYPGADEVCDSDDNDCDGTVDDNAIDAPSWYDDDDGDGYGDLTDTTRACTAPSGSVANSTDCDDTDDTDHPGATEVCDGDDDDCDGTADESGAVGEEDWYLDYDHDGYGDPADVPTRACDAPLFTAADATDCDDHDDDINPGATEYCDGVDDDCDGTEDGTVTFRNSIGIRSDYSSTFGAGTASAPVTVSVSSGGTFLVCEGTYYVGISSTSVNLTIEGVYGRANTILDGAGSKRTVYATGDLTLESITLTNGYSSGAGGNLYTTSDATLTDVLVTDGQAVRGGNIAFSGGTVDLTDVDLDAGDATYGGNAYFTGADLTADTLTATNGSASYGGGLYFASSSTGSLATSELSDNTATTSGGGVYQAGGTVAFSSASLIENNVGGDYGGGAYVSIGTFTISNSNIRFNESDLMGGGIYYAGASTGRCTGTTSGSYGIYGNDSLLGGGVLLGSATGSFTSTTCDWTLSDDNSLYDVIMVTIPYSYGNNASFSCTGVTCS